MISMLDEGQVALKYCDFSRLEKRKDPNLGKIRVKHWLQRQELKHQHINQVIKTQKLKKGLYHQKINPKAQLSDMMYKVPELDSIYSEFDSPKLMKLKYVTDPGNEDR